MNVSEQNAAFWLLIRRSGTWWTPQQVDRHFQLPAGTSFRQLHNLERNGALTKAPIEGTRSVKFAVTDDCHVPRGIKVGEVLARAKKVKP